MSDVKRLQSIGPAKKDKKSKSASTTIRLNLTLPTCNSDTFANFNYNSLILNEKKKKEKNRDKVNGTPALDPCASDDEDQLRQIARSFESRYGTPKKKCRRLEDYTELGTGYDENDSFIDNTDAYDEVVPEDQTPELDGFYINKGQLIFKQIDGHSSSDSSSDDESDGPQNMRSNKRQLSSESESDSSDSSGSGSSEGSDDDTDDDGHGEEKMEVEESSREIKNSPVKEVKSNGHVSPVVKKPKLLEIPKKSKSKGVPGSYQKKLNNGKDQQDKRIKLETSEGDKRFKADLNERDCHEKQSKLDSEDVKHISNVDAAIEAVARGEDSKESGIAESKSHSESSGDTDSEEAQHSIKENGQMNGVSHPTPLPEDLPSRVQDCISALKQLALKNSNLGKQQFFTPEVNTQLLRFEKEMRFVPKDKKGAVYEHLESYIPCRKETLIKRSKALLLESVEAGYKEPLSKLKAGIDSLMPSAVERYQSMCKKYNSTRNVDTGNDPSDPSKSSPEKTKIPRRRFPWTDDLKDLLCVAVKKRRIHFGNARQKGETWEGHLVDFLKKDVLPMWQNGWMKVQSLKDIIQKMAPDLLEFTPISPGSKSQRNSMCPLSKKPIQTHKQTVEDIPKTDLSVKKVNAVTNNVTVTPKPVQNVGHQSKTGSSLPSSEPNSKSIDSHRNGGQGVSSINLGSNLSSLSQANSSLDLRAPSEVFVESIRTSLANSLVSVTPIQSSSGGNLLGSSSADNASKPRTSTMNSSSNRKSLNSSVEIINLQNNGIDVNVDVVPKKRQSLNSAIQNVSSYGVDLQDLSKPQPTISLANAPSSQSSHSTSHVSSPSHNSIKVSSVSAINLKLSGSQPQPSQNQSQTSSSKLSVSQPLKAHSNQNSSGTSNASHRVTSSYGSHGLEPNSLSSSLTITPVKPSLPNTSYYQQTKGLLGPSSGQSTNSPNVPHGNTNIRSEVIVTPSNANMPHIKSTNVNFSDSSTISVSSNNYSSSHSSGNNFSTSHSASASTFTNSHNVNSYQTSHGLSSSYSSPVSSADASVRTHRPVNSSDSQQIKHGSHEKSTFAQPSRSQASIGSSWPSGVSVDVPRSSSSSPSSVKSVTPSPEKTMVSRKDRLLQDSRERAGTDQTMPTLSGPYRQSSAANDSMRSQIQQNTKRKLPEVTEADINMALGVSSSSSNRLDAKSLTKHEENAQKAQELAMRGILMSRTNCDGNYGEEPYGGTMKKTMYKSSNDISDQRLSGMGALSSSLSMTGLDGMSLGLPSHLVGYQNDYQRHLYGSSSKTTGPNDHRPL